MSDILYAYYQSPSYPVLEPIGLCCLSTLNLHCLLIFSLSSLITKHTNCWFKCGWWLVSAASPDVSLIGPWGWVRLHACCSVGNQCAQLKPSITTHTQGDFLRGNMEHRVKFHFLQTNRSSETTTLRCPVVAAPHGCSVTMSGLHVTLWGIPLWSLIMKMFVQILW